MLLYNRMRKHMENVERLSCNYVGPWSSIHSLHTTTIEEADLSRSRNFCRPSSVSMLLTSTATLLSKPSCRQQLHWDSILQCHFLICNQKL